VDKGGFSTIFQMPSLSPRLIKRLSMARRQRRPVGAKKLSQLAAFGGI